MRPDRTLHNQTMELIVEAILPVIPASSMARKYDIPLSHGDRNTKDVPTT
jgi:hypothetical protein